LRIVSALLTTSLLSLSGFAQSDPHQLARDILKELIEINTTDTLQGSVTKAAEAMAQRFRAAGFPDSDIHLVGPSERPDKTNLVVRYRGTGAGKPLLVIGHLDVVQALPSDWTTNPFQLVEKNGYLYGRGTEDMKGDDAIVVTELLRFKQEGYKPERDLIVALTADEEGGKANGVDWLLKNHRDLVDAEYVLNPDGGGPVLKAGKPLLVELTASEKAYADYKLTVSNSGGHSSRPTRDNAIYHLTGALERLHNFEFPFELNAVTKVMFARMATLESGQVAVDLRAISQAKPDPAAVERLSQDPSINAKMRTTCVPTILKAGHANNALPQTATANVNCRIFPGHTREQIRQQLIQIFKDPQITVEYVADNGATGPHAPDTGSMPPPPIRADFLSALEKVSAKYYPGGPVVPAMDAGASDDIYTNAAGLPSYEVAAIAIDDNDDRAHGKDERVRVAEFDKGVNFYYDLLKAITSSH